MTLREFLETHGIDVDALLDYDWPGPGAESFGHRHPQRVTLEAWVTGHGPEEADAGQIMVSVSAPLFDGKVKGAQ